MGAVAVVFNKEKVMKRRDKGEPVAGGGEKDIRIYRIFYLEKVISLARVQARNPKEAFKTIILGGGIAPMPWAEISRSKKKIQAIELETDAHRAMPGARIKMPKKTINARRRQRGLNE